MVEATEARLADRGVVSDRLLDALNERAEEIGKSTRRVRKKLAKQRKQLAKQRRRLIRQSRRRGEALRADVVERADRTRDEVVRLANQAAKKARQQALRANRAAQGSAKGTGGAGASAVDLGTRRRRWRWLLGLAVVTAAAGYAVLSRRPQEVRLQEEPPEPRQEGGSEGAAQDATAARAEETNGQHARDSHPADRG